MARARIKIWRPIALGALLLTGLAAPGSARASSTQFSILQDDGVLLGSTPHDPNKAMAEAKALGVDVVRVGIGWSKVSPKPLSRTIPAGFDVGNPNSPGYDWRYYDNFVERARLNGLKVLMTLAPPLPFWASEEPSRCPHRIGGYRNLALSCMWKPKPKLFGEFVKAVVRRYGNSAPNAAAGGHGGQLALYSLWNEPNLEHYLYPQLVRTRHGTVDVAARRYRELWIEGWKAIAASDPGMRNKVLFGETAAISSPMDTLYAALCLDERGRPFRGKLKSLQGCARPERLPIGGLALHPYNKEGGGSVFSRSFTQDSLPLAHVNRAHRLMDRAARLGRIPRGRGIYITEFGFQSSPPDRVIRTSLPRHAAALNEAERLFYGDRRIKSTAQYEIFDAPDHREFNTGLRLVSGRKKPAWDAYRMPLVVTKLSGDLVEVWGHVRPARGRVRLSVTTVGSSRTTVARPRTNSAGYFRILLRRRDAARLRYRLEWSSPDGGVLRSRIARAGPRIRYFPDSPTRSSAAFTAWARLKTSFML